MVEGYFIPVRRSYRYGSIPPCKRCRISKQDGAEDQDLSDSLSADDLGFIKAQKTLIFFGLALLALVLKKIFIRRLPGRGLK